VKKKQEKRGRPHKFTPERLAFAKRLAMLGLTDKEMAFAFDVTRQTILNWKKNCEDFKQAIRQGQLIADSAVADSLFKLATGYEQEELYVTTYRGKVIKEKIMKRYKPDTTAIIFWLKNRWPKIWRDISTKEVSGPGGKPIDIDWSTLDEDELEFLAKLGLKAGGQDGDADDSGAEYDRKDRNVFN